MSEEAGSCSTRGGVGAATRLLFIVQGAGQAMRGGPAGGERGSLRGLRDEGAAGGRGRGARGLFFIAQAEGQAAQEQEQDDVFLGSLDVDVGAGAVTADAEDHHCEGEEL